MTDKHHIQTKYFTCGHKGFGQYCHLCMQLDNNELVKENGKYKPVKKNKIVKGDE